MILPPAFGDVSLQATCQPPSSHFAISSAIGLFRTSAFRTSASLIFRNDPTPSVERQGDEQDGE
jgi:hypothetical protein